MNRHQISGSLTLDTTSLAEAVTAQLEPVLADIRSLIGVPVSPEQATQAILDAIPDPAQTTPMSRSAAEALVAALAEDGYTLTWRPASPPTPADRVRSWFSRTVD